MFLIGFRPTVQKHATLLTEDRVVLYAMAWCPVQVVTACLAPIEKTTLIEQDLILYIKPVINVLDIILVKCILYKTF